VRQDCCARAFLLPLLQFDLLYKPCTSAPVHVFSVTSTDFPHITVSLSLGCTRATSHVVEVSLLVPQGAIFPTPMAFGTSDTAGTSANMPVNDLPREVLKVEKFEGRKADRRYCASWLSRVDCLHFLLGYGANEDTNKLDLALTSLPVTSAAGQWYDSQLNTPETSFSTWSTLRSHFLTRMVYERYIVTTRSWLSCLYSSN
jgi:hypothetical protein